MKVPALLMLRTGSGALHWGYEGWWGVGGAGAALLEAHPEPASPVPPHSHPRLLAQMGGSGVPRALGRSWGGGPESCVQTSMWSDPRGGESGCRRRRTRSWARRGRGRVAVLDPDPWAGRGEKCPPLGAKVKVTHGPGDSAAGAQRNKMET